MPYLYFILSIICFISCQTSKKSSGIKTVAAVQEVNTTKDELLELDVPDTIGKLAKVVFDSSKYEFGTVYEGDRVQREIFFTNKGPGDLVIELITACECTQLDWSRLPIKKDQRSRISIEYNSKGKNGPQIVDVDIIANTEPIVTGTKFFINVKKKG